MNATQAAFKPLSSNDAMNYLPSLPEKAAEVVKRYLDVIDIEQYKYFLYAMYHYTLDSEAKLLYASKLCNNPALKKYFKEMAKEERGHYLLAQRDIEEFGINVVGSPDSEPVRDFRKYWYDLGTENDNEFLGAMFVFENIASLCVEEVRAMVKRLNLTKRQARWLLVHLEADEDHGAEAYKMCLSYASDNPEAISRAAQEGVDRWIAVFEDALSNTLDSSEATSKLVSHYASNVN